MKFFACLLLLLTIDLFSAEIDERKIDIYFANGIDTIYEEAKKRCQVTLKNGPGDENLLLLY